MRRHTLAAHPRSWARTVLTGGRTRRTAI